MDAGDSKYPFNERLRLMKELLDTFKAGLNFTLLDIVINLHREVVDSRRKAQLLRLGFGHIRKLAEAFLIRYRFHLRPEDFDEALALCQEVVAGIPQEVDNDVSYFFILPFLVSSVV